MNVRRFVLRLAVGLLCFAVGLASALLLGASRAMTPPHLALPSHLRPHDFPAPPPDPHLLLDPQRGCVIVDRVIEKREGVYEFDPFRFEVPHPPRPRHAHEWHDVPRVEEFELRVEVPLPPPPPRPRRADR